MAPSALSILQHKKRNSCRYCRAEQRYVDYKDFKTLQRFTTPQGKVYSRKRSGNCAYHQRRMAQAIKRARFLALISYVSKG